MSNFALAATLAEQLLPRPSTAPAVPVPIVNGEGTENTRKGVADKGTTVQFSLMGFSQDTGFRVFAFERVAADRTRTKYTVRTDLALTRKYGIRPQELPLLCRGLLERGGEGDENYAMTFTEADMCRHARECAEARDAAIQRKLLRRPPPT